MPGFDQRTWHRTGEQLVQIHLGAPPRFGDPEVDEDAGDDPIPLEDIFDEGCPGAWWRAGFVQSLLKYRRRPCEGGGRVANPLLDRCDDPTVIEAIAAMEVEEDHWLGTHLDLVRARMRQEVGNG